MKGLLKFITCGSVDDGKSTLIGHILYDAKLIYADQKKALELESKVGSRGGAIDYSLLLDGLMAEREQGITIDVAYRYFTTDHRSFIVADTPGHEEYTRNMAVGASFADLAIILLDATQGVLTQTRRHARICKLMGIKHFIFALNKMDLAGYEEARYQELKKEIEALVEELALANVVIIPISATEGDNVTKGSPAMAWYQGPSILEYLETVDIQGDNQETGFYMPVQRVCRPNHNFRGFQGQIEAGTVAVGDEITALPSGEKAKVKAIAIGAQAVQEAQLGQPVTIQLDREVDVSRGCVLAENVNLPVANKLVVTSLWMDDVPAVIGKEYLIKLGTKTIVGTLQAINYKIDINTGAQLATNNLVKNEIGVLALNLQASIVVDEFAKHRTLGELIVIDRITNMTSACGVVTEVKREDNLATFVKDELQGRGDIFDEYFYDMNQLGISKKISIQKQYTVGSPVPLEGKSYSYPRDLDILLLRDKVAVVIRAGVITAITDLAAYEYSGAPMVTGRGFALKINNPEEFAEFRADYQAKEEVPDEELFAKWVEFNKYRHVVFCVE